MKCVGLLAAFGLLTGCASIMHGTHQRVVFDVRPPGALVTVADVDRRTGTTRDLFTSPASPWLDASLRRERTYRVTGTTATHRAEIILTPTIDGWAWGNLIWFPLGGPLGVGVALVVDWAIGGLWSLEPDPVILDVEDRR